MSRVRLPASSGSKTAGSRFRVEAPLMILVGTLLLPRKPLAGAIVTGLGCLAGLLPTMWTVVVPILLIALATAAADRAAATVAPGATAQ